MKYATIYAHGDAVTFMQDKRVLGSIGLCVKWRGSGVVWTWLDKDLVTRFPVWLRRETINRLRTSVEMRGLWRVESDAPTDAPASIEWLESLGFVNEGLMPRYGYDGRDHYRYAWVDGISQLGVTVRQKQMQQRRVA